MSYLELLGKPRNVDPAKPTNGLATRTADRPASVHATREVHWGRDGDSQYVRLELSEDTLADLLYGLASALRGAPRTAALFAAQISGQRPLGNPHSAHVRRDIAKYMASRGEDYLRLDDEQAGALNTELDDVLKDIDCPEACHHPMCDHLTVPGDEWCESHQEAMR